MPIDRTVYFDRVRETIFDGVMNQRQVDGQTAILDAFENNAEGGDLRKLAYALATTFHETAATMQPIEEYNGASAPYGQPDPETGQRYYGRGFVQLTHRTNYARADKELDLFDDDSCEWHAENALKLDVAGGVLFLGMMEGWFRSDSEGPHNLPRYFNETLDAPVQARNIINGDMNSVPSWSGGQSIGNLIAGYHGYFLEALKAAYRAEEEAPEEKTVTIHVCVDAPPGVRVVVIADACKP